jgi:hypothetical protein
LACFKGLDPEHGSGAGIIIPTHITVTVINSNLQMFNGDLLAIRTTGTNQPFFQIEETCRLPVTSRLHSCLSQWQPLKPKAFHSTSACPQPCSRMTSAPTSADACLSIVHSLMCHRSEVVLFYSKTRISPWFTACIYTRALHEVAGLFSFGPSLAKSRGFPQNRDLAFFKPRDFYQDHI